MDTETAKFITELANSVAHSVYGDAFSPAMKEFGGFLQDVAKTLRRALPQMQLMAVDQDRFRRFLEQSIERVPPEQRIAPAEQILGPIMEGIRYEPEGSMSDEAFSELLSRAFDRERTSQAHPAFPALIRGLSDDEIKLLRALARLKPVPSPWPDVAPPALKTVDIGVAFPSNVQLYMAHLSSLGLLDQPAGFGGAPGSVVFIDDVHTYRLSPWGWALVIAVTDPNDIAPST